jgi:hypothetical protein
MVTFALVFYNRIETGLSSRNLIVICAISNFYFFLIIKTLKNLKTRYTYSRALIWGERIQVARGQMS